MPILQFTTDFCVQDTYIEHLTSELHNLEEQLGLAQAQCSAQTQETKAIKEILTDATMELEVITPTIIISVLIVSVGCATGEKEACTAMEQCPCWHA